MNIADFLEARLDEDGLLAREATPGPWAPEQPMLTDVVTSALLGRVADCSVGRNYRPQSLEDARHIARHDPARVLREVTAKRAILALHQPFVPTFGPLEGMQACTAECGEDHWYANPWPCPTLKALAAVYDEEAG